MELTQLLLAKGFNPKTVLVVRHQPTEPALRRQIRWLASEDQNAYMAYQSSHSPRMEAAMLRASHLASFVADGPGRALFVGLYDIIDRQIVPHDHWLSNPTIAELVGLGSNAAHGRDQIVWFEQKEADFYSHWRGRLVVAWPPPERSWFRWADRNVFSVLTIHEDDELLERFEQWDKIVLNWNELKRLPRRFRQTLQGWRGIYVIHDKSDGKSYVGSAYGADNILGRWLEYAKTGHGDNAHLRRRNPENFEFAILERLADNLNPIDVVERENSWKVRLRTRFPAGLNAN